MTNEQLYFALGMPALGMLLNLGLFGLLFMHLTTTEHKLIERIDAVEERITGRIEVLTSKVVELDNRVSRIEERLKMQG